MRYKRLLSAYAAGTGMKTRLAHNAQQRVQDALARGEIKKPKACQVCGASGVPLEFAHSDYRGRLNGKWLCRSCHRRMDAVNPKGGGSGSLGTERAS